jgi:hypothetical protein
MDEEIPLRRARTFDNIAELYDRAQREFPDEIISSLFDLAGIEAASRAA